MRISSRQLDVFEAAYRLRSARLAASALHISQPAVSRMIADLEAAIGARLFDRSGRGFEPNFAAENLHIAIRRHHVGIDRVVEAARQIGSGHAGHAKIFALPVLADNVVAVAAGRLMKRFPALRFDIEAAGEVECREAVLSGRADLAVMSTATDEPEFVNFALETSSPVVALPPDDPLAKQRVISLSQLAETGLLLLPPDSPFRQAIDRAFSSEHLPCRVRGEARTQSALIELVGQGAGRAIVFRVAGRRAATTVTLRRLRADLTWPVVAILRRSDAEAAALKLLLGELRRGGD
jgi:DNA-binding transcriptional LysR family regulator